MSDLRFPAYRFSVSWPRVQPDGRTTHLDGLDFYDRLVDASLANGSRPFVTLSHRDLPRALEDAWQARDTAFRFAEYALEVHTRLGDRVDEWATFDALGHGLPGGARVLRAAHHLLLGHGLAVHAMRMQARPTNRFSVSLSTAPVLAGGGLRDGLFVDPLTGRGYPADVLADIVLASVLQPGDEDLIAADLDWLGISLHAPVAPAALTDLLRWAHERTGLPVVVDVRGHPVPDGGPRQDSSQRPDSGSRPVGGAQLDRVDPASP